MVEKSSQLYREPLMFVIEQIDVIEVEFLRSSRLTEFQNFMHKTQSVHPTW